MIAFNQTDILHFGADLQHRGTAFHLQVLNDGNAVTVRQQVAVRIFYDERISILSRLGIIPFMSAFRADEHAIIFIGVFRIAFWAVWERHIGILKSVNALESAS